MSAGRTELFRPQVISQAENHFFGSVRLARNPGFSAVAFASIIFMAALLGFAVLGHITRKATLPGLLVPSLGSLSIATPQFGTLSSIAVKEGERVQAGQTLMVLDTDRTTSSGSLADQVRRSLQERRQSLLAEMRIARALAQQKRLALLQRIESMRSEQRQAQSEVDSLRRRVDLAKHNHERYLELARKGFVSDIQVQQKQEDVIDLSGRLSISERNVSALRRDQMAAQAEAATVEETSAAQLEQLNRSLSALDQESIENSSRGRLLITAPQAGFVSGMTVHTGGAVQQGQTLATLLPASASASAGAAAEANLQLSAELYSPSRAAGFVHPAQPVWLRYAAFPYQRFGMAAGRVKSVDRSPISPQDLPAGQAQALLNATQSNEPLYRIHVALESQHVFAYGDSLALKPGMALEADVIQDRRAIWEWMLDPVLAVRRWH